MEGLSVQRKMRRRIVQWGYPVAIAVLLVVAGGLVVAVFYKKITVLYMGSGGKGTMGAVTAEIARFLNVSIDDIKFIICETEGTKENLELLQSPRDPKVTKNEKTVKCPGYIDMALITQGSEESPTKNFDTVRAVAPIYRNYLQIVADNELSSKFSNENGTSVKRLVQYAQARAQARAQAKDKDKDKYKPIRIGVPLKGKGSYRRTLDVFSGHTSQNFTSMETLGFKEIPASHDNLVKMLLRREIHVAVFAGAICAGSMRRLSGKEPCFYIPKNANDASSSRSFTAVAIEDGCLKTAIAKGKKLEVEEKNLDCLDQEEEKKNRTVNSLSTLVVREDIPLSSDRFTAILDTINLRRDDFQNMLGDRHDSIVIDDDKKTWLAANNLEFELHKNVRTEPASAWNWRNWADKNAGLIGVVGTVVGTLIAAASFVANLATRRHRKG